MTERPSRESTMSKPFAAGLALAAGLAFSAAAQAADATSGKALFDRTCAN
jgi:cytochrome c5